ncbi:Hypothetical predicted protein [Paramuricea clavata]|uniref:Mutator-like transposase domain-containing protein n=1 Tax=Paramuricea clavata TaxID=317549 RepID=A0A7D9J8J0_PARCT|nr:Hypothetical predicted protein [Paramuricea clavata]
MYTRQRNSEQTSATGADISAEEMSSESSVDEPVQIETKDVPASARKLDLESSSEDEIELPESTEGFRFVDIAILAEIMETFWCPECRSGNIIMKEKLEGKKGFASQMILECSARNCKYLRSFYTSKTVCNGKAFEVNRRAVLAG